MITLSNEDINYLKSNDITTEQVYEQIAVLKKNQSFLKIEKAATIGNGILKHETVDKNLQFLKLWENETNTNYKIEKFVPASGAASRMFSRLLKYYNNPTEENFIDGGFYSVKNTVENIGKFAFTKDINTTLSAFEIVKQILYSPLYYVNSPKGLIKFHNYNETAITAFEEHLKEAKLLNNQPLKTHFTISEEYEKSFRNEFENIKTRLNFDTENLSFSYQEKHTNTVAIDDDGNIVRDNEGNILLRPGGHGSLIHNLNKLNSDIVFINNIDNVTYDNIERNYVLERKILGGKLLNFVNNIHNVYNSLLNEDDEKLLNINETVKYLNSEYELNISSELTRQELLDYLNRPIRVCGMVKNTGEPGGGPFWVKNNNGKLNLQIIEKSQINLKDEQQKEIFESSTHFNPVDILCYLKNCKGEKFDLTKYIDKNAAFVSDKTYNGKNIKILENPGLWNGAMSNWLTLFVEIPIEIFNPVKELNDLLKTEHQK